MAFHVEHQEGRLYIIALRPPNFTNELEDFRRQVVKDIAQRPDGGVLFLNVTEAALLLPTVAAGYTNIMRDDNAKVVRSAIFSRPDMLGQQVMRMVAEAGSPKRCAFFDAKEAVAWLGTVLTPRERKVMDAYLQKITG